VDVAAVVTAVRVLAPDAAEQLEGDGLLDGVVAANLRCDAVDQ
jgi:hypothetical protein